MTLSRRRDAARAAADSSGIQAHVCFLSNPEVAPPSTCVGAVANDPMYGPAVRRRGFVEMTVAVLHQCIRPSIGACMLLAIMDISAHAISLSDRPRLGHLGHQCSHAPGRPILHLVSSSRRPRQVSRIDLATSSGAPHVASPCDVEMRIRQTGQRPHRTF